MSDFQTLEEVLGKDPSREGAALRAAFAAPTSATLLLDGDNNMAEVQDLFGAPARDAERELQAGV